MALLASLSEGMLVLAVTHRPALAAAADTVIELAAPPQAGAEARSGSASIVSPRTLAER